MTNISAEVLQIGAEKRNGAVAGRKGSVDSLKGRMRGPPNGHAKSEDSDNEVIFGLPSHQSHASCAAWPSTLGSAVTKRSSGLMLFHTEGVLSSSAKGLPLAACSIISHGSREACFGSNTLRRMKLLQYISPSEEDMDEDGYEEDEDEDDDARPAPAPKPPQMVPRQVMPWHAFVVHAGLQLIATPLDTS